MWDTILGVMLGTRLHFRRTLRIRIRLIVGLLAFRSWAYGLGLSLISTSRDQMFMRCPVLGQLMLMAKFTNQMVLFVVWF